jgi:glycerol-3-phosphate dehydrogenase
MLAPSVEVDVVVIGCGIVGVCIARNIALQEPSLSVAIVDKEDEPLSGASGANAGILHCGFDASPGLLETQLVAEGHVLMRQVLQAHEAVAQGVARPTGGLVVAWSEEEWQLLLQNHAVTQASHRTRLLTAGEVKVAVPALKGQPVGGMFVPDEWVVDRCCCRFWLCVMRKQLNDCSVGCVECFFCVRACPKGCGCCSTPKWSHARGLFT